MDTGKLHDNSDTYLQRNMAWLRPLLATVILSMTPGILKPFGMDAFWWWTPITAAIGCCLTGFFAVTTDTLSAKVVRVAAQVAALAVGIWFVLSLFNA
ncbi:hypothetical protein [Pseudomonas huaxiensis]|uniref:hypothetical protein n=1 Tax=Pseudomonas huaxiensis TaxID=2213017 RepID=UPI000DA6DAFA|nr:hypothetical protein [Pseudomonas huaxiensis]